MAVGSGFFVEALRTRAATCDYRSDRIRLRVDDGASSLTRTPGEACE